MAAKNGQVLSITALFHDEKPIDGRFVQVFFIATLYPANAKTDSRPSGDDEELNSYPA